MPPLADLEIMQDLIHRHSISFSTFSSLVYSFFDDLPKNVAAKTKSNDNIRAGLGSGNIDDKLRIIVTDEMENDDLEFDPALVNEVSPEEVTYSAGLLVGLATIYPGCRFNFYKAVKFFAGKGMRNNVVFSVELNNYQVYFGDLSEIHP